MDDKNIGLMYLAEETSPENYKVTNLNITEKMGAVWATFDAVLHSFDVLNRNRRMYDGDNTMKCIETSDRIQDGLRKKCWYGEQDHPGQNFTNMSLTAERVQKIDMGNRSHAILNPHREGNLLKSTIETCPGTECGIGMARDMIRGLIPSFSCRSIAVMKMRNGKPYVEIKKIITYDWVIYPSHREAEMISTASITNGSQKILLESTNPTNGPANGITREFSKDVCIPFHEFADFREFISESDENLEFLMESCDYSIDNITGIDVSTKKLIIESVGSKLYVNTSVATKKKVEDFLSSF